MVIGMRKKKFSYNNQAPTVINVTQTDVMTVRGFHCMSSSSEPQSSITNTQQFTLTLSHIHHPAAIQLLQSCHFDLIFLFFLFNLQPQQEPIGLGQRTTDRRQSQKVLRAGLIIVNTKGDFWTIPAFVLCMFQLVSNNAAQCFILSIFLLTLIYLKYYSVL